MKNYEFDEKNHPSEPLLIAVKCVYYNASYKIKLILDGPYGRDEKPAIKFIKKTQRLSSGLGCKRYAVKFIYENLGIFPIGHIATVHNGKEIDSLIYEHFNKNEPHFNDSGNNFTQLKTLFKTGQPLQLASLGN